MQSNGGMIVNCQATSSTRVVLPSEQDSSCHRAVIIGLFNGIKLSDRSFQGYDHMVSSTWIAESVAQQRLVSEMIGWPPQIHPEIASSLEEDRKRKTDRIGSQKRNKQRIYITSRDRERARFVINEIMSFDWRDKTLKSFIAWISKLAQLVSRFVGDTRVRWYYLASTDPFCLVTIVYSQTHQEEFSHGNSDFYLKYRPIFDSFADYASSGEYPSK